ncbi:hypothetical protein MCEMRE196_01067 [Candidatus Nanopelagicaceae bacterium]
MSSTQYQPGVCNIGGAEVQRRKQVAQLGSVLFLAFAIFAFYTDTSQVVTSLAIIPAMLAAVGYVQSKKKFCFAFGLLGTFNFGELGKLSKVAAPEAIAADRALALKIIGQSFLLALVATAFLLVIKSL